MVRLLNRLTQPARLTSFFIVVVLAAMVTRGPRAESGTAADRYAASARSR